MSDKILLIAGGSDPAGSEMDGNEDSLFNRQNSFGNLLANKIGYTPVNIAISGSANTGITRSVLEWFDTEYKPNSKVFVLIGFADSIRMEAPWHRPTWHNKNNAYADWFSQTSVDYMRITPALQKYNDDEDLIEDYQRFMACAENFLQIYSANLVLQLQYFFNSKKIPYLLLNTLYMFDKNMKQLQWYLKQIDNKRYINFDNNDESFFTRYDKLGFKNNLAKYLHHGIEPHKLYAEYLYKHITTHNLLEYT